MLCCYDLICYCDGIQASSPHLRVAAVLLTFTQASSPCQGVLWFFHLLLCLKSKFVLAGVTIVEGRGRPSGLAKEPGASLLPRREYEGADLELSANMGPAFNGRFS